MSNQVDLSQLAVDRRKPTGGDETGERRRWLVRYALPSLIVFAFVGIMAWAARDRLLPFAPVTVAPVVVSRVSVQRSGTPLFQAAGWVEPRPASLVISSLAPGVIDKLLVVEGQSVVEGEPIARLLDTDARMAVGKAKSEYALCEADVEAAQVEVESAKQALENPIQLQVDLADAESQLARVEAEWNGLPFSLRAAQTRRQLADENVAKKRQAGPGVAGRLLRQAAAEQASAIANAEQMNARSPVLAQQLAALRSKCDALRRQLELKLDQRGRLASAQVALKAAQARLARSQWSVEAAELQLRRMTIYAPVDGRVLSREARPGKRVVGIDPHSEQGASAIATLYDPRMLQIRVDVRLEDVPQVQLGQAARIETASAPAGLMGYVTSVTSLADIQKNTLQVKVALTDPPDVIRPEMLAQVTFLAPEPPECAGESEERLRTLVPRQLVVSSDGGSYVWLADRTANTARRQPVTVGSAGTDQLVEIASGLTITDKLICSGRETLRDGQRIRVAGEDVVLGIVDGAIHAPSVPRTAENRVETETH